MSEPPRTERPTTSPVNERRRARFASAMLQVEVRRLLPTRHARHPRDARGARDGEPPRAPLHPAPDPQ